MTPSPLVERKSSFAAVANADTRILILGSLPGQVSLDHGEYYAHPQNQFWRLVGAVIGTELAGAPYPERLSSLLRAGVGLWDVVRSAERTGSLDSNIRKHEPNALEALAASLPALQAIAFNGGKAADIGRRSLDPAGRWALVPLPSSSPAYTLPFEQKRAQWRTLIRFL